MSAASDPSGVRRLASPRRSEEHIGGTWPALLERRCQRLAEQERS
ncbi:hypothetical protein [Thermogemmatispora sp.]